MTTATAQASPNIAFIKYWGNRDNALRLPVNGSISMNLDGLYTRTTVSFQPSLPYDELIINGHEIAGPGRERVSYILDFIREMANIHDNAEVMTENNFPSGAGIASSASAFAAATSCPEVRPRFASSATRSAFCLATAALALAPVKAARA